LLNYFLPTQKLIDKKRCSGRIIRVYGPSQTSYMRVLAATEVERDKKNQLRLLHERLNPFQLAREIDRQKKIIEACRLLKA
jgi:hypothetical protein